MKLAHDYVLPGTIADLRDALDLNEMQVFQSSGYIDNSWKILLGVVGLALVIALSAYLLVYNILYLSAAGKSRYYGLLQTLGMTERQVAQLVRRQMLGIAFAAMAVGTMLGAGTSLVVVPQLMRALGITEALVATRFHPLLLVLTLAVVFAAVLAGLRAPLKMAQQGTLVEAMKAQRSQPAMLVRSGRVAFPQPEFVGLRLSLDDHFQPG